MNHAYHKKKKKTGSTKINDIVTNGPTTPIKDKPPPEQEQPMAHSKAIYKPPDSKVAVWTLVIGGIVAAVYFMQLLSLQATVEQMQAQTRLSVRPYIGLDEGSPIETTPLHIDETGNASLVYKILAKNYSNSPASNVWAFANLVVADDLNTVYEQQGYACGDAVIGKPDIGLILFPGRDRVFNSMPGMTKVSIKHEQSLIGVWLAGCIGYRDQFGYLYRTKFMYALQDDANKPINFVGSTHTADISGHFVPYGGSIDAGRIPKYK